MLTDLEGVSGVVSFIDQTYDTGKYNEQAKKLLTAEVNAAARSTAHSPSTATSAATNNKIRSGE